MNPTLVNEKEHNHRFEVHTYTICEGWINVWTIDDTPQRFATIDAAYEEINEFINEIVNEINSGERDPENGYEREDFRIFDTVSNVYVG